MPTRIPINTNANSRTVRSSRTSSLMRQIQKAEIKYSLDRICIQIDDKSHRLHEGSGRFKPGTLIKIVENLKSGFPWIS